MKNKSFLMLEINLNFSLNLKKKKGFLIFTNKLVTNIDGFDNIYVKNRSCILFLVKKLLTIIKLGGWRFWVGKLENLF